MAKRTYNMKNLNIWRFPMNDRMKSLRNIFGQTMWIALLAVWSTAPVAAAEPTEAEIAAYEQSFEGYCQSVEDFLDCRPIQTAGNNPEAENLLLKWGREQGLQGLEGEIPLSRRRSYHLHPPQGWEDHDHLLRLVASGPCPRDGGHNLDTVAWEVASSSSCAA